MKKKITTIHEKVLVDGCDAGQISKHEVLAEYKGQKVTLKELVDGTLTVVSDGKYQEKSVAGTPQVVSPSSGYDAMSKVTITAPNRFTKLVSEANKYYSLTATTGGDVTINNITGGVYILGCRTLSGKVSMYIEPITSNTVTITVPASAVDYIAFYSSSNPEGQEATGVTKATSTQSDFNTAATLFVGLDA